MRSGGLVFGFGVAPEGPAVRGFHCWQERRGDVKERGYGLRLGRLYFYAGRASFIP